MPHDVKRLQDLGADLNVVDGYGMTTLHYAVQEKHIDVVQHLLASGAIVDPQDKHGNTPLFRAVYNYKGDETSKAMIDLLVKSGANPDRENKHRSSPRKLAELKENGPSL